MASLLMATVEHSIEPAQRQEEVNLRQANDRATLHENDEKIPKESEHSSAKPVTQEPDQLSTASDPEWKAGRDEWMIIVVLAIVSLMVALDATILVPVLPVSALNLNIKRAPIEPSTARLLRTSSMAMQQILSGPGRLISWPKPSVNHSLSLFQIPSAAVCFTWSRWPYSP